jgi:hypothetical protein
VRQNGREAIIDTVTREVEVKEEMMIDTEEGYSEKWAAAFKKAIE